MSDYNREIGRLIPLCKQGEATEKAQSILEKEYPNELKEYKEHGWETLEILEEVGEYRKYMILNDILYENRDYKKLDYVDFCNIKEDPVSGEIEYDTTYWNGCTCLSEVLENAIKCK